MNQPENNLVDLTQFDYFSIMKHESVGLSNMLDISLRYKNLHAKPSDQFKIPNVSHHIWFTKPSNPSEMRSQDIESLKDTISFLDSGDSSWQHILWTNCKTCIPQTIESFNLHNLQIKEISEIKDSLVSYNIVGNLIEEKKFGIAADFFRFDLLEDFGGFYTDLNYIFAEHPENYMRAYDFLTHTDRGGLFVDVYMIAAKPHHPILEEATSLVYRNFVNPPLYVQAAKNATLHIQEYTGVITYMPFNSAFFKHVNQDTIDLAFPLEIKGNYPDNAKHAHYSSEDHIYIYPFSVCDPSEAEFYKSGFMEMIENYKNSEICMENILGFDKSDGNSWFEEPAKYVD